MPEIDNLDIQISAGASAASSNISQITGKFKALGGAVQGAGQKVKAFNALAQQGASSTGSFAAKLKEIASLGATFTKEFAKGFKQGFTDSVGRGHSALLSFLKTAKRIAIIRAIRAAIRFVTDGIGEGMKNLYAWSKLADGTFKGSMDMLATSAQYAGNSIAAMASPLINALAPAIDFIIDKFVQMFNTINQILAKLTGKGTYTAAVKTASAWSGAAKKAGGAANDMKKTILAFDEINKLADQNSGGGGGGSSADAGAMFEERPIDSKISDFVAKIKLAVNTEDWEGLGTILGEKINEIIDGIPWAEYGKKVGEFIKAWFTTKYWTIRTTDYQNIGKHLAEFLNAAIKEIPWNIIGRSISQWPTKIFDLFIGFIKEFDFGQAATAISDFFKGLIDEWTEWFERQDWVDLGNTIADKLADFFANLDYGGVAMSIAKFLWSALKAAIGFVWGFLGFGGDAGSGDVTSGIEEVLARLMEILEGSVMAIGMIMLIKGHPLLGIAMMASAVAGKYALDAATSDKPLADDVREKLTAIGAVIAPAMFTIGALLAFGGHPAIGIALMAANAATVGASIAANWDEMPNTITKVIAAITAAIGLGEVAIGAMLAFAGHPALGIGMMVLGLTTAATSALNWGLIPEEIKKTILDIMAIVGPAELALGAILLFAGRYGLGIALLVSGLATTATAAVNWDSLSEKMKTLISDVLDVIGKASMLLGILAIIAGHWGIGLGLIVLSIASSAAGAAANPDFDSVTERVAGIVSACVSVIAAGSLMLGIFALLAGHWAIGLGLIAAGVIGLVTSSNADWGALNQVGVNAHAEVEAGWNSGGPFYMDIVQRIVKKVETNLINDYQETERNVVSDPLGAAYNFNVGVSTDPIGTATGALKSVIGGILTIANSDVSIGDTVPSALDSGGSRHGSRKALGGLLSGGRWHNIPAFAGGGIFGSMFLAGEAGPELVGHVGNRTEVLNKSQLASAMFAAVRSAMAPTEIGMREAMNGGTGNYATGNRGQTDTTLVELLREQNELLMAIAEKEITTSGINYAQRRANRRAGITVVPVGT